MANFLFFPFALAYQKHTLIIQSGLHDKKTIFIHFKADIVKYKLDKDMDKVGIHEYSKITPYPNLLKQRQYYIKLQKQVEATGYKPISQEWYKDMVQKAFKSKK